MNRFWILLLATTLMLVLYQYQILPKPQHLLPNMWEFKYTSFPRLQIIKQIMDKECRQPGTNFPKITQINHNPDFRQDCFSAPNKAKYTDLEYTLMAPPLPFTRGIYDDNFPTVRYGNMSHHGGKFRIKPSLKTTNTLSRMFGKDWTSLRGFFYYPPQGYREWHTNAYHMYPDQSSREEDFTWRAYFVKCSEDGKAWFKYLDPKTGKIIKLYDYDGLVRIFKLPKKTQLWHCVYSDCHRFSMGLQLKNHGIYRLLRIGHQIPQSMSFPGFLAKYC